jgi:futalosine hydrolase
MKILIVAATIFEIRPLLDKFPPAGMQSKEFTRHQYKNHTIDVVITGVGMVPAAYILGKQLALQTYDLAINAGIAGSFNKSLPPGSVVNVVEDSMPEVGAEDGDHFLSVFELGLADPDAHPFQEGRLINDHWDPGILKGNEVISKLPAVKAITSSTVRGNASGIARILRISKADIESMEGAAFFFACMSGNVCCIQIRSISNMIEERDKSRWAIDLALKNLNNVLWDFLTTEPRSG